MVSAVEEAAEEGGEEADGVVLEAIGVGLEAIGVGVIGVDLGVVAVEAEVAGAALQEVEEVLEEEAEHHAGAGEDAAVVVQVSGVAKPSSSRPIVTRECSSPRARKTLW